MIIVTSTDIAGYRLDAIYGEVMGVTVRSRDITLRSRDIVASSTASLRSIAGGELPEMTRLLSESCRGVMRRMITEAEAKGVTTIVAIRFDTPDLGIDWADVCAYGRAVIASPIAAGEPGSTLQSAPLAA